MRRSLFATALFAVHLPAVLEAQFACKPKASSNEARLLAFFAVPLAFSSHGRVARLSPRQVVVAGDLTWVPKPSAELNRSTGACGFSKSENTSLAAVFPRPRVIVGLRGGFAVEASYLPPVTVADATPNLGAVALSWASAAPVLAGTLDLAVRAHATFGHVRGPVTCATSALQQSAPSQSCYGTQPSADTYAPNVWGAEAAVARGLGALAWYAGAGVSALAPHFQVDFTDLQGFRDRNTIDVSLTRVALFGGAAWRWSPSVALSAQIYSVPVDATTGRVGIAWRARG